MTYQGECFASEPAAAMPGQSASPITKTYTYGRTRELHVMLHASGETSVAYEVSGLMFTLPAGHRGEAFAFATERREHMRHIGL